MVVVVVVVVVVVRLCCTVQRRCEQLRLKREGLLQPSCPAEYGMSLYMTGFPISSWMEQHRYMTSVPFCACKQDAVQAHRCAQRSLICHHPCVRPYYSATYIPILLVPQQANADEAAGSTSRQTGCALLKVRGALYRSNDRRGRNSARDARRPYCLWVTHEVQLMCSGRPGAWWAQHICGQLLPSHG